MVAVFALAAGACMLAAQTPDPTSVVRLSYVQGNVQILAGDAVQFDQAQANMPLLAGYTLSTGQDGQAEVEFTDGSVARITPESRLRLDALPNADAQDEVTELTMLAGLGYFELNTANGQRFAVHFNAALARPVTNTIFRLDLDNAPDLAVFVGTVRATVNGAFDQTVEEGNSLRFDVDNAADVTTAAIQGDSWDQWNRDRDTRIAQEAQQQTSARETSGATTQPGWDDLDAYGNWYPVEGYGDVWMPDDTPEGWDPYDSGYWANYPGWGYTWISGYPWGWLPYHCGAWNYWNSVGWGWIPGQCGLGWQPAVNIWNTPHGWRPPPRPIPGGHAGPPSTGNKLVAVHRGPVLPDRNFKNTHTKPVRFDGQSTDPLPVLEGPALGARLPYRGGGASPPVGRTYGFDGNGGGRVAMPPVSSFHAQQPGMDVPAHPFLPPMQTTPTPRPMGTPERMAPAAPRPMPAPARSYSPPPAPRTSAPPSSAPHESGGGHH